MAMRPLPPNISEKQFIAMCEVGLDLPVRLSSVRRPFRSFIYDRDYGLMTCPGGMHLHGMATLLAFHHNFDSRFAAMGAGVRLFRDVSEAADYYLEHIPGTAFFSSLHSEPHTWRFGSLNAFEHRILGPVQILDRTT